MNAVRPWIKMASGKSWFLTEPAAADVDFRDIANHLAKINRFVGGTETPYSVAQHCCLVSDYLDIDHRVWGLLHDAHEAYLGDWSSPLKETLRQMGVGDALKILADRHDVAIFTAAGLPATMPPAAAKAVKHADDVLFQTEDRDLTRPGDIPTIKGPPPLNRRIMPWPWTKAADEWLTRLERLTGLGRV